MKTVSRVMSLDVRAAFVLFTFIIQSWKSLWSTPKTADWDVDGLLWFYRLPLRVDSNSLGAAPVDVELFPVAKVELLCSCRSKKSQRLMWKAWKSASHGRSWNLQTCVYDELCWTTYFHSAIHYFIQWYLNIIPLPFKIVLHLNWL